MLRVFGAFSFWVLVLIFVFVISFQVSILICCHNSYHPTISSEFKNHGKEEFFSQAERVRLLRIIIEQINLDTHHVGLEIFADPNRISVDDTPKTVARKKTDETVQFGEDGIPNLFDTIKEDVTKRKDGTSALVTMFPLDNVVQQKDFKDKLEFSAMLAAPGNVEPPLKEIREYYGENITHYYAMMWQYTHSLAIPAIFGVLAFLESYFTDSAKESVNDLNFFRIFVFFAALTSVWSTLFVDVQWSNKCDELELAWYGLGRMEDHDLGEDQYYPRKKGFWNAGPIVLLKRVFAKAPVFIAMLISLVILILSKQWSAHLANKGMYAHLPVVVSTIVVVLTKAVLTKWAEFAAQYEGHENSADRRNSIIRVVIAVNFMVLFVNPLVMAFVDQDLAALRHEVAATFTIRQVIQNGMEWGLPLAGRVVNFFKWLCGGNEEPAAEESDMSVGSKGSQSESLSQRARQIKERAFGMGSVIRDGVLTFYFLERTQLLVTDNEFHFFRILNQRLDSFF